MQRHTMTVKIADSEISFETGKIAKHASGSVLVRQGETIVFTAVCGAHEASEGVDFLPLRVDYQEKFSSAGKTLGGFLKREGRPSEKEVLVSRLIDRPLRPMFPEGYHQEIQVLSYVWSYDGESQPDVLAITGASTALVLSDIPLVKPLAGVRVGRIDGQFVVNPTTSQMKKSTLDLVLAGTDEAILMIEGFCDFLTEEEVIEAISKGHEAIKLLCKAQIDWREKLGKPKNLSKLHVPSEETKKAVEKLAAKKLEEALRIADKQARNHATKAIKEEVVSALAAEAANGVEHKDFDIKVVFEALSAKIMRQMILKEKVRSDGRGLEDIRPIDIEQGLLPRTHGSSLFTRGETQTMAVCTLGGETMGQRYEDLDGDSVRRFYMQYSFPPFSVGEVGKVGSPGRREVGHGKLAERALSAIVPPRETFPYAIRLESNITESNGSSSMASVCGGCLAMMDAGVPVKRVVSGIAMGLILEKNEYAILSDILGLEDALGDMDFKVTGDEEGITAFQMDIKVEGITLEIMKDALAQAKRGRVHILKKMLEVCPKPKEQMSAHAPRITNIQIKPSKIGALIGPGGKQIRAIIEETGAQIDVDDSGLVSIASNNQEAMEKAQAMVMSIVAEVEVGKTYSGKVTSVKEFGAFVELLPGKEGLCHISELDSQKVNNIFDFVKEGDRVQVKVLEINDRGQVRLSRKALLKPAGA